MITDEVWKLPAIVDRFLSYRAAIPLAQEQLGVMMAILKSRKEPVDSFLDLGCGDGRGLPWNSRMGAAAPSSKPRTNAKTGPTKPPIFWHLSSSKAIGCVRSA